MTYYWIVAQHSGKVLDVEDGSLNNSAKVIQRTKKPWDDANVGYQLWSFDNGFIINKNSGLVLDVSNSKIRNGTQIVQNEKHEAEPSNQQWDYNDEENTFNTINLRADPRFVLDVAGVSYNDGSHIVLYEKNNGQNQRFILQQWNNNYATLGEVNDSKVDKLVRGMINVFTKDKELWDQFKDIVESSHTSDNHH